MPPKKRSSTEANMHSNSGIKTKRTKATFDPTLNPSAAILMPASGSSPPLYQPNWMPDTTNYCYSILFPRPVVNLPRAIPTCESFTPLMQHSPLPEGWQTLFIPAQFPEQSTTPQTDYPSPDDGSNDSDGRAISPNIGLHATLDILNHENHSLNANLDVLNHDTHSLNANLDILNHENHSMNANLDVLNHDTYPLNVNLDTLNQATYLQNANLDILSQDTYLPNTNTDHPTQESHESYQQVDRSESPQCVDPREIFLQPSPEPATSWTGPSEICEPNESSPDLDGGRELAEGQEEAQAEEFTEGNSLSQIEHLTAEQIQAAEALWERNLYSLLRGELDSSPDDGPQQEEAPGSPGIQPDDSSYSVQGNDYVGRTVEQGPIRARDTIGGPPLGTSDFKPGSSRKRGRSSSSEDEESVRGEVANSTNQTPDSPAGEGECSTHDENGPPPKKARKTSGSTARGSGPSRGRPPMDGPAPESGDKMAFLIEARQRGMSYQEIKDLGGFEETVSTLRGKHRNLTKGKEERVRRPKWTDKDIELLKEAVASLTAAMKARHSSKAGKKSKKSKRQKKNDEPCWGDVAKYIVNNGGSYKFGHTTCHRKWLEVSGQQN